MHLYEMQVLDEDITVLFYDHKIEAIYCKKMRIFFLM